MATFVCSVDDMVEVLRRSARGFLGDAGVGGLCWVSVAAARVGAEARRVGWRKRRRKNDRVGIVVVVGEYSGGARVLASVFCLETGWRGRERL